MTVRCSRFHRKILLHFTNGCILLAAIGSERVSVNAQTAVTPPQLYLTSADVPKKGYIEKGSNQSGKVSLHVCNSPEVIVIDENLLLKIAGSCSKISGPWGIIGAIKRIKPDSSVEILTMDNNTIWLSPEDWRRAFINQPPDVAVGDFIGGTLGETHDWSDKLKDVYVIERKPVS